MNQVGIETFQNLMYAMFTPSDSAAVLEEQQPQRATTEINELDPATTEQCP